MFGVVQSIKLKTQKIIKVIYWKCELTTRKLGSGTARVVSKIENSCTNRIQIDFLWTPGFFNSFHICQSFPQLLTPSPESSK